MSRIQEIIQRLSSLECEAEEREQLQKELPELAAENETEFRRVVRSVKLNGYNPLFEVYEALEPVRKRWEPFLLEELDRLLNEANHSDQPRFALETIEAFSILVTDESPFVAAVRQRLFRELESRVAVVRRRVAFMLPDVTTKANQDVISKLEQLETSDPDWKVRYNAAIALGDIYDEKFGARLTLMQRIRATFSNPLLH